MTFMTSKTREIVCIPSRKQAIEIMPVAITSAKYPGNRSAAARERGCGRALFIRFFIASFAVELETEVRGATFFRQNPRASSQRRIMTYVLSMPARQNGAPVMLVVLIEIGDLLLHRALSRT